ncbi:MAG TPA: N-acetylmuramoyl-L-alanine amidase [Gammaproteobacteria bacterium]
MRVLAILVAIALSGIAHAQNLVQGVRMWPAPDNTRLVFDVKGPPEHALFTLSDPDRIVIDIKNAQLSKPIQGFDYGKGLVSNIRTAMQANGDLRVVLDLKKGVRPKSFALPPNAEYGHRLVVDLADGGAQTAPLAGHAEASQGESPQPPAAVRHLADNNENGRDIVIAIDAGHGGDDPGAIGANGTREKNVVLAIALKLAEMVRHESGMRPVLTRDGDYYIGLRRRVDIAREQKADLFISIHADAFKNRNARGSSVFTLSPRGASSEYARLLAEKENDSDLIGGVSLDDKDDVLASVLLDLSQTATMEASSDVGGQVLSQLRQVNLLHKPRVEQAGFRVLKAPDLPSILVETAFISNRDEERKLRNPADQQRFATAIMQGVRGYFRRSPPPGSRIASTSKREHVIARGETLSSIARHYQVSTEMIRAHNGLGDFPLSEGQVIRIPEGDS